MYILGVSPNLTSRWREVYSFCELRRFFASHARTFAHLIFGRTHIARTCAFCQNSNRTRTRTCAFVRVRFAKIRTRTLAQSEE